MSWIDKIENIEFSITTGDGKTYKPLWKNGEKSKDFNFSKYEFINVSGSLIERKKPQSNKYPLVFYFQGEDNIDQANDFENSANDNRLWTIEHPFYGTLKGQPVNLKRNDSSYNVTEITVDFWESVDEDFPFQESSFIDKTRIKAENVNALATASIVDYSKPNISSIATMKENNTVITSKFKPDTDSFNDYKNIANAAIKSSSKIVSNTQSSFENTVLALYEPASFYSTVREKLKSYGDAYNVLKSSISSLFDKYSFESQAAVIISSMCLSCVNPVKNDYITRSDIEEVNSSLTELYNDYLKTLDDNQVSIYDINNAWSPNILIQNSLIDIVSFTTKSLFSLSFNASQERIHELLYDSNLIILTHRFIGLDASDENIDNFRKINNIKNDELYKIKKGRLIKYFIK